MARLPIGVPLTVSEITNPSDLIPWTRAMYDAFVSTDNVLAETLFGLAAGVMPSQSQLDSAVQQHRSALNSTDGGGQNHYIQILDPATGAVAGGAKWVSYSTTPERPETVNMDWIDDSTAEGKLEREFAQAVMDEFHGRRVKYMASPHALLNICYTSPDYERRGVASALVKWGMEKADKEGWTCFTEASPRGTPVYARLGFKMREDVSLRWDERGDFWKRKGNVRWTFMERSPIGQQADAS